MLKALLSAISQFAPVLLTLLLATSSYWLALQSELDLFGQKSELKPGVPDYFFSDFRIEEIKLLHNETMIVAGHSAEHFPRTGSLVIDDPVVTRHQQQVQSTLSATSGVYKIENDQLHLTGNVKARKTDSIQTTEIETEYLFVDGPVSTLTSQSRTTIKQPGRSYQANSFQYNYNTGQLEAQGAITLKLEAPSE